MSSSAKMVYVCLVVMMLVCVLVQETVTSPIAGLGRQHRRSPRRIARSRYRVGYMFGKRDSSPLSPLSPSSLPLSLSSLSSSSSSSSSSNLLDIINDRLVSDRDLAAILQKDPETLLKVASLIDKDDNGYITMSDFL